VPRDPPERLLELGCGEEEPAVDLGAGREVGGEEALLGVLLGQVEHDGHRLGEHQVVVDQHGELTGRIDLQELGATVLAGHEVHGDRLEFDAQLLKRPARADRAGGTELVEPHHGLHFGLLWLRGNPSSM